MSPKETDTALVIFAKYPQPGKVKTRLSQGIVPGHRALSLEECAQLYAAFLRDYQHRFAQPALAAYQACFCLRPGPDLQRFQREFATPHIGVYQEPAYKDQPARDIGQALGYTFRGLLAAGFRKVVILGSDLPHFPDAILPQAVALLDQHPLVLGSDGGGCYLMAASTPAPILEAGTIPWSQGRDFAALCDAQGAAGLSCGVLPEIIEDIDHPDALARLALALTQATIPSASIPHTHALLQQWGLVHRIAP